MTPGCGELTFVFKTRCVPLHSQVLAMRRNAAQVAELHNGIALVRIHTYRLTTFNYREMASLR